MDESKGIALAILGIVAVLAVVGLVLMFVRGGSAGAATLSTDSAERWYGNQLPGMRWSAYGQPQYYQGSPCGNMPSGDPEAALAYVKCLQNEQATYGYS